MTGLSSSVFELAQTSNQTSADQSQRSRFGGLQSRARDVYRILGAARHAGSSACNVRVAGFEDAAGVVGKTVAQYPGGGRVYQRIGLIVRIAYHQRVSSGRQGENHPDISADRTARAGPDGHHAGWWTSREATEVAQRIGGSCRVVRVSADIEDGCARPNSGKERD